MRYVAEQVGAEPDMFFDTCASPGAHSGGAFWRDRRTMFDCAIAIGTPRRRRLFSGLMRVREAVPTARVLYFEPDIYRPGDDPAPPTSDFVIRSAD